MVLHRPVELARHLVQLGINNVTSTSADSGFHVQVNRHICKYAAISLGKFSRRGYKYFPGFVVKEDLKTTLEKGLTDGWKEAVYACKDNADQVTFGSI